MMTEGEASYLGTLAEAVEITIVTASVGQIESKLAVIRYIALLSVAIDELGKLMTKADPTLEFNVTISRSIK